LERQDDADREDEKRNEEVVEKIEAKSSLKKDSVKKSKDEDLSPSEKMEKQ
jgi:hypothetical protein